MPAEYLTVRAIAEPLKVKQDVVLTWIRRGELLASNVAASGSRRPRWRVSREDLAKFLEARRPAPCAPSARRRRRSKNEHVTEYFR